MLNRISKIILGVGVSALVVALLLLGTAQAPANAAPAAQTTVTPTPGAGQPISDIGVSGTGQVFGTPDTAIASVGVDLTATTLAQATTDAATRMNAVIAKIKELGVDAKDITTISYTVNPQTSNPKEGEVPRIVGYHVSNIVQVKIRKIDDAGKILDAAIAAGANSLNSLSFTIDDPSSLESQARTKAVQDAMAKAKTLADAANVKLGRIISITETVARLKSGTELRMMQTWPVRVPRPVVRKLEPTELFVTGQRVLDVLYPVAIQLRAFGTFALVETVVFIVFFNTVAGVRNVDPDLVNAVWLMGGTSREILLKVIVPHALSAALTGVRIAIPYALIGAIVGELIASNRGIGYLVSSAASQFDTAGVFAALIVLTILATMLNSLVNVVDRRTSRWKVDADLSLRPT